DAAILPHGAPHQLVGGALLPAHVGAEGVLEEIVRGLAAGDGAGVDGAGLLEGLAEPGAGRHGGRAIYTIKSSPCARWSCCNGRVSCSRSRETATRCSRGRRADRESRTASSRRATTWRRGAGWALTSRVASAASPTGAVPW